MRRAWKLNKIKYIIVDNDGIESAIVFPDILVHRDVARIHSVSQGIIVRRAGFCRIKHPEDSYRKSEWKAFGESISLKKKSDPVLDSYILNRDFPLY